MIDCLFCKIAQGEIPATLYYENKDIVVFDDINPQAPIHKLIIPREHIATLNDLQDHHQPLVGQMLQVASSIAKQLDIADVGYRLVSNCNAGAGQTVFHIHFHLLGGRPLHWPPG
jgi:histidine triad (HIT) family protein